MFEAMAIANAIKSSENNFQEEDNKFGMVNPASDFASDHIEPTRNSPQASNINANSLSNFDEIINEDRPLVSPNSQIQNRSRYTINNDMDDDDYNGDKNQSFETRQADRLFAIKQKYEMGEMAGLFFNKIGQFLFYLAMILYLYGDLAIYDAAVPKSLRDTTCTFTHDNASQNLTESDPCWNSVSLNRMNAYRIYVVVFNLLIGPLVFYNLQKTKFLQLATTLMRWLAFITMIALAIKKMHENSSESHVIKPAIFNIKGLPNFFGVCIYAFMCHHSLPSIITPIRNKEKFKHIIVADYLCIMIFYLLLSYTGIFAFGDKLEDFYTLNFLPEKGQSLFLKIIDYYLSLFPVFTISASFPIIGITLRNNLKSLYYFIKKIENPPAEPTRFITLGLPLITLIPPLIISLITHDLQLLVGITGSYAGVAIQYIIPSCLVYFGRRVAIRHFRRNYKHSYASPFKNKYWVFFVLLWANISVIFVTVNHIINKN